MFNEISELKSYLYNLHSMNTAEAKPQRQSDVRVLVKSFLRERIMEKSQFIPFDNSPCQYQQPTKYSNITDWVKKRCAMGRHP